jgi:hypothetical protein
LRLGDSIVVSRAEADLLQSEAFGRVASPEVRERMVLEPIKRDSGTYLKLALPHVGRDVIDALSAFAASGVTPKEAITAQGLAVAIAQRLSVA